MRLFVDTNILVRCSLGKASARIVVALERGVVLSVTSRNVDEFVGVLRSVFGFAERDAMVEAARILRPFEIVEERDLEEFEMKAIDRLHAGGKSDWPSLAAAMAFDAAIWSDDRDYFGVGVRVWSTPNVQFASRSAA